MFASDLKIVPLAANDVVHSSKGDNNNSPMIRYQKQQHHYSQKYQNNHHNNNNNGNNNRKKFQKVPTVNNNNINANVNTNKNHHNNNNNNNGQSYSTNNRKKPNHQFNNSNSSSNTKSNNNNSNNNNNITNNNNSNLNKNSNNTYNTPTRGVSSSSSTTTNNNSTVVIKNNNTNNNICSDQNLVPKNRCDTLVSKNNTIASDLTPTSKQFQKPAASSNSNSLVSSSSSLSSSLSSSSSSSSNSSSNSTSSSTAANIGTNNSSTNNNNKNRLTNRFNTASNHHRKKVQQQPQPAAELEINNKQKSPIPIMVIHNNNNGLSNHHLPSNQQLPAVFTAPICTTSSAPSSAPVSPSSYSLNFLHSVGVQMAHNGGDSRHHMGNNHHHQHHHVYSNSATVSPAGSTHNMIMQGQRIIYQDVQQAPPAEKQRHYQNQNGQRKFSPKAHSPPYNHRSYDIPILINNNHHSAGGDHFSSPYNYPPLNNNNHNNYKRNSYIPVSHHQYQKQQNDCYSNGNAHTPTYNRNRNQNQKAWNTNGGVNAHKNATNGNGMLKHHNSDYNNQSNQMISRVKNHQNLNNLTYVTTDAPPETNNNKNVYGNSRSQSSSPKMDYPQMVNKATNTTAEHRGPMNMMTPIPVIGKGDSFSPGGSDDTHQRVASEGYESDSSNSSSCDKRASTGHSNFLSSSSSSLSSTEIPYHPPPSIVHALNYPTSFADDDLPIQHYYGSEQNLSQWIPALHAQFMFSAHGIYPPNGSITDFQQQQFKKSQSNRSSYRGGRGRNKIHNNDRSTDNTNNDISFFNPADRFLGRSHIAELREAPRTLLTCSKWDNLSQGIWNKFVNAQQTDDTFKRKMKLWRYLYIIVKNAYPRLGLYLVGSTMSGFGADTSDIDMCLVSKAFSAIDPRMEALFNLTLLKECLMKTGEFEKFNLIEAKVPILRFKDKDHNLEVDLNFNNCVGIKNTHLLFCYSQLDWRLRPLVLVTKLWAQYHNINNAKTMTISSYSLVLMVIHFLQCAVSPPVLPCLHEMYPDKFHFLHRTNDFGCVDMNETLDPYNSQNNQSLGQLFLEFLHYYSNFNYSQYAISIRTGALIPIEYCRQAKSLKNDIHQWKELCIEEPFDLTNTARSVYDSDTFERVKLVFVSSFRVLQETLDINSIFSPLVPAGLVQEK